MYVNFRFSCKFVKNRLTNHNFCVNISIVKYSSLAQSVEHLTVNQRVVGSSPTRGALWPVGQAVKTPPFHGDNGGSIPPRVILPDF